MIVLGGGFYEGWGLGQGSYTDILQGLLNSYNDAVDQTKIGDKVDNLNSLPSYHNQAWSINFAKLGQMVFNLRTGQQ